VHRASKKRFDNEEDFKTRARAAVTALQSGGWVQSAQLWLSAPSCCVKLDWGASTGST
jgi:hypothetical protein